MSTETRWSVILAAAGGQPLARDEFVRRYASVIRSYLAARWRGSPLMGEVDDAAQDVFLEFLKEQGALSRAEPSRSGGFRAFLYGVVRNVARRFEERRGRSREEQPSSGFDVDAGEEPLSKVFDRAWAAALLRQAFELQAVRARAAGEVQRRRVELLRLRFIEGRTLVSIAAAWGWDEKKSQYEGSCATREFEAALLEIVRRHHPDGSAHEECARLLQHFS